MNTLKSSPGAVILLSGGLDSSANCGIGVEQGFHYKKALTIDYGQRAAQNEIQAAQKFSEYYKIPHQVIELKWLGTLGKSRLTHREQPVPVFEKSQLDDCVLTQDSAQKVWVPNRNGIFIELAAAWAESLGCTEVVVGFNKEEAQTFPDNSVDYIEKINQSLFFSTQNHVKVHSFTAQLTKIEIVRILKKLKTPFHFDWLWSCYVGDQNGKQCGQCESCQRLSRALTTA